MNQEGRLCSHAAARSVSVCHCASILNVELRHNDKEGKPTASRYHQVNAMLLNELLKEHQKVQELAKQIGNVTAAFQKVSDRLKVSKAPPQIVNDP
jgi:uncharacterized protein YlxW (UPF0749 family)